MTRVSSCSFIFNRRIFFRLSSWKSEKSFILFVERNCFTKRVAIVLKQESRQNRGAKRTDCDVTYFYRAAIGFSNRLWPSDCELISFAVRSHTCELSLVLARCTALSRIVGTVSIIAKEAQARWNNSAGTQAGYLRHGCIIQNCAAIWQMFNACRGSCPTPSSVSAFNVNMSARAQSQSRMLAYPADVVILSILDSCSRPTFPFSYNFCVHFLKRNFLIIQTLTLLLL